MNEVFNEYVDTVGNYHYTDTETGHHVIQIGCEYCHEDKDGYVRPFEKNCHAFFQFPNKVKLKFGNERREFEIRYCPICGRKLEGADNG